ncbi:MAG: sulfatase [Paenibacillus sp.]|nr:sulfatase [Paenibacillus sp.]
MGSDRTAPFLWKSLFFRITVFIWIKLIVLRVFIYHKIDWSGVALDLASVVVIAGLIELFVPGKTKRAAFWSLNIVASLILFAATLYYTHFGSIVTYTSLYGLKQILQVSNSVKRAMHPENYIFFIDLAAAVLLWIVWRRRSIKVWSSFSFPLRKASMAAVVVVALAVSALSVRVEGKVRNELIRAEKLGFFNYQSSFVLEAWENSRETKFTDAEQAAEIINAVQSKFPYGGSKPDGEEREPKLFGTQKGKNLIVVQVESLQNFTIGYTVDGQPLTPVLNELERVPANRSRQYVGCRVHVQYVDIPGRQHPDVDRIRQPRAAQPSEIAESRRL